jgi:hypothetical protein
VSEGRVNQRAGRTWASVVLMLGALLWLARGRADAPPQTLHTLVRMPLADRGPRVHRFRLPVSGLRAEVVDLQYRTPLADALGDADLVVNGGYWGFAHDARRVLIGLVHAGGRELSPLRHALDGGVLVLSAGLASIQPSRSYQKPVGIDLAVQCSPRLLAARSLIPKLKEQGRAARTGACVRDGGKTLELYLTEPKDLGPSLSDFAQFLLAQGCEHALNLDGGPSTAAGYREQGQLVRIGAGRELPYALRFTYSKP